MTECWINVYVCESYHFHGADWPCPQDADIAMDGHNPCRFRLRIHVKMKEQIKSDYPKMGSAAVYRSYPLLQSVA